jgi:hypothetical protein
LGPPPCYPGCPASPCTCNVLWLLSLLVQLTRCATSAGSLRRSKNSTGGPKVLPEENSWSRQISAVLERSLTCPLNLTEWSFCWHKNSDLALSLDINRDASSEDVLSARHPLVIRSQLAWLYWASKNEFLRECHPMMSGWQADDKRVTRLTN